MADVSRPPFSEGQVVTVFRSRRRTDTAEAYLRLAGEIEAHARSTPGFVDFKTFAAEDGERVSLITFATPEAHRAWRDDPRHRAAQQRGRDEFYLGYSVQVGECDHVSQWVAPGE
ncbi:MAG: antibiotic biosynthesis monooxygenase family protein [Acidimicrobiales bacterium]|jgi:heme-degrading monooxygenase HmoA